MSDVFIGIDVGGTFVKIGCFDSKMNLVSKTSIPTNADMGPDAVLDAIAETIEKLVTDSDYSKDDIASLGIGTPGPAKYREGIIVRSTNMPKFTNVHITKELSERFGKPVAFENDGNVACWGEHACGAGKGVDDMVFFTLGTGIGGAIVNQGKLLQGCADNATELGHMIIYPDGRQCNCGQKGCVEAYASASWTAVRATEAVEAGASSSLKKVLDEKGRISCKDVFEHLKTGDALAKKITDETAKALAIMCINMLHATEPKRIVFAGGMIAAGDILLNRIKEYFDEMIWNLKKETVEICFATLGEDAGIIGAADLGRLLVQEK
ncbi:MAG: ROK family protein [Planctomycetes bacterium]|nr:ROK family protein [Planctomycetota bacterium]